MAKLGKARVGAPGVSTAVVDWSGLGGGVQALGQGVAAGMAAVDQQKVQERERWADQAFQDWRAGNDARVAQEAAAYDGRAPGLALAGLGRTDAAFQPLLDAEADPDRRIALQQRFDGYRAQVGAGLSQQEAAKRAEPIRLQRQAVEDSALSNDWIGFLGEFSKRQKAREAGGLGAVTAAGRLEDYDAASKAVIEAAPEDRRPRLQAALAARRTDEFALGQKAEEAASQGLVAEQTAQGIDTLVNTLLSDPGTYAQARGLLPQLAGAIQDPGQRMKFEASGRAALAGGLVQGLINEGQLGAAKAMLDAGRLDGDLNPQAKQGFIQQIAVAERVGRRRARIAAGGDGDEEGGDGGGLGGVNLPGGPSFENLNNGYATDPLKYAVKKGKAPVQAMDPNMALAAGAGAGDWGKTLQQRRAVGIELHLADGVQQRMLTNAEVTFFKDAFERDPNARYRVAEEARAAVGGQGAQDLLREIGIGDEAPVTAVIAHLAAGGSRKFAADAQRGLSLKAQGAELTAAEKRSLVAKFEPYRGNFSAVPETFLAAQRAAEAAYLADKASGTLAEPEYYALRALGGVRVNNTTYGGGATMRRQATVLPGWLNPDYADDALLALGEVWAKGDLGPRFGNGEKMTAAQIGKLALKVTPSGWYQLVNDKGQAALRKNGQPFMFDMDRDRRFLGSRLGGKAVLGAN